MIGNISSVSHPVGSLELFFLPINRDQYYKISVLVNKFYNGSFQPIMKAAVMLFWAMELLC